MIHTRGSTENPVYYLREITYPADKVVRVFGSIADRSFHLLFEELAQAWCGRKRVSRLSAPSIYAARIAKVRISLMLPGRSGTAKRT